MTNSQYQFLLELLADKQEYGLISALIKNPYDKDTRGVYTDYLLDLGRNDSAELVRNGFTPGGNDYLDMSSGTVVCGSIATLEQRNNWLSGQLASGCNVCSYSRTLICGEIPSEEHRNSWLSGQYGYHMVSNGSFNRHQEAMGSLSRYGYMS